MSNTETAAPQVVQSYGHDSLVGASSNVVDVREFFIRLGRGERAVCKQVQQHPAADESSVGTGILNKDILKRLYGRQAGRIRKNLADRGYCRTIDESTCVLTWRFRNVAADDFEIGLGARANLEVYRSLDTLLWTPLPSEDGFDAFQSTLKDDDFIEFASRISETEYWFRQGVSVVGVRFRKPPSEELLSLLDHKLQVIQQDKMQNYFHIIASFNSDAAMWMSEEDRSRRFFEIIGDLLSYSWRPFDMQSCEVSIDAAGDEALIASGSLRIDFTENGLSTTHFDRMEKHFPPLSSHSREFTVNDVALRAPNAGGESSFLSLHMVSRSPGNVDPRRNMLTHRFVKLFIESVGKLIDVILPVIRREEAERNLKWRYFLDALRLRSEVSGEDIHRIITDSLRVARRHFGVSDVQLYTEDWDISRMLNLFGRGTADESDYQLLDAPLSPAEILRRQKIVFPIREIQGGRVLLYFDLPYVGQRPLNPEIPDQYLAGTELWQGVHEEALILGVTDLKDYLFFMATECLTANPKALLSRLNRRLPVRGGMSDAEDLMKLSRRVLERYSRFFELFRTMSANLESGLAYMRGRRDNMTGLYNRQHFKALLAEAYSTPGLRLGLMFIDMDNFKIFNDAVSHDFGDKLLRSLANRMIDSAGDLPNRAVPGRFGGDEFCFSVTGMEKDDFEAFTINVFKNITERPLVVSFYFDDRSEGPGMEVNIIAFLHRLLRPDIGSRQASRTEYVEKPDMSPRAHVVDIWKHYQAQSGEASGVGDKVKAEQIIGDISAIIEDKILYNKIFPEIDDEFHRIIRSFVGLQLRNHTTNRIRDSLISEIGGLSVERFINLKVSAGLAHSSENRLRSMESLFKAADNRAYLAKSNGRNCMFGVDGAKIA